MFLITDFSLLFADRVSTVPWQIWHRKQLVAGSSGSQEVWTWGYQTGNMHISHQYRSCGYPKIFNRSSQGHHFKVVWRSVTSRSFGDHHSKVSWRSATVFHNAVSFIQEWLWETGVAQLKASSKGLETVVWTVHVTDTVIGHCEQHM